MCSILVTSKKASREKLLKANEFQRFRGPDSTDITTHNDVTFLHNLLSITGEFTTQPFIQGDVVAIYNGEIYNHNDLVKNCSSDGVCLIPTYHKFGRDFLKQLDGEFAVVLVDFKNNKIVFGIDTFGCKPLFYSFDDGYHFASYKSALETLGIKNIHQVEGNEWFVYDINNKTLQKYKMTVFDTDNEYKDNFDDWNNAFEEAVKKRGICSKRVMMGVSEGYDSGCIASCLVANDINFKMYSVNVLDVPNNVLLWRHGIVNKSIPRIEDVIINVPNIKDKELIDPTLIDHIKLCSTIYKKCDFYEYTYYEHKTKELITKVCKDTYGFLGAGFILSKARKEGFRVCLSGLAGDIIGSPEINKKLKEIDNINHVVDFDDNNVYSCEYCCGVHGIEIRYPFLDKKLWQETLWLDKSIYKKWKHPHRQYMLKHGFPFVDVDDEGKEIFEKFGFYRPLPDDFHKFRNSLVTISP